MLVEERLLKCEKQLRLHRIVFMVLLIAFAGVAILGMAQPKRIIDAEAFILRDASGRVRARLEMSADRPTLTLLNVAGIPQVGLAGGQEPFLVLDQANGDNQVKLSTSTGLFGLALYGKDQGKAHGIRAGFGVFKGAPAVSLYDENGEQQIGLDLTEGSGPSLVLGSPNAPRLALASFSPSGLYMLAGKQSAILSASPDVHLSLEDSEGYSVTVGNTATVNTNTGQKQNSSAGSITIFNKDKKVSWSAP